MAGSTIMTAKNSFLEGLIMDFAPDNTQANCMTSALNATLLTFNGNEMQLQNDMGNGRVETAYLPDGYVPVGTCEFGDIIYIVSYNPLIDKALIGCFPSPERNISSEELHVPNDSGISASDFLELSGDQPTGNLRASSVKKILFLNNLHPGDKFIIASSEISENSSNISAYGSTNYNINDFPKLVKIHVVSVDEAGKITYLDSDVKWYDDNNYYISPNVSKEDSEKKIDIDLYRDLLNSGYSVFKSKTSGQLALLVELEKITGFGCTWECYKVKDEWVNNQQQVTYDVYVNLNWNTDHNDINPHGAIINGKWATSNPEVKGWEYNSKTKQLIKNKNIFNIVRVNLESELSISRHYSPENVSSYTSYLNTCYDKKIESLQNVNKLTLVQNINGTPLLGKYVRNCYKIVSSEDKIIYLNEEDEAITTYVTIDDTLVNNYFNYPVTKKLGSFTIPINTKVIAPENKSEGAKDVEYIRENDLSQLIYNYKIVPTMPYGKLDEFTVDGYIDFSKIGKLHIELHTWKYYNSGGNSTLTWGMDAYTDTGFVVKDVIFEFYNDLGLVATLSHPDYSSYNGQFTDIILLDKVNTFGKWTPGSNVQNNKLESNSLYLVKIIVKQGVKTVGGEIVDRESGTEVIMSRWLWTNEMFNKHYYVKLDYDSLKVELNLDCDVKFSQDVNIWKCTNTKESSNFMEGTSVDNIYKTFSANVQTVESGKNNVNANINIKLQYDYGTFTLTSNDKFNIDMFEGYESLVNYPEKPQITYSGDTYNEHNYIYPTLAKPNTNNPNLLEEVIIPTTENLWTDDNSYSKFKSTANLKIENSGDASNSTTDTDLYVSSNGKLVNLNSLKYISKTNLNISTELNLQFSTKHYSKYYYTTTSELNDCITMRSCLYGSNDLNNYNLYQHNGKIFFNNYVFGQALNELDSGRDKMFANTGGFVRTSADTTINAETVISTKGTEQAYYNPTDYYFKNVLDLYIKNCADHWANINFVFPFIFGWDEDLIMNDSYDDKISEFLAATYMVNKPNHGLYPSACVKRADRSENSLANWKKAGKKSDYESEEYGELLYNMVANSNKIKKSFLVFKYPNGKYKLAPFEYNDDDFNINKILSLLQLTYYQTLDSSKVPNFYKDNFIYLDSNYTAYTRDVVFRIKNIIDNTLQLNGKGTIGKNSDFIKKTITNSGVDEDEISENNYTTDLRLCIKSYPVLFKIDYIKPYIEPKDIGSLIRIEGLSDNGEIKSIKSLNIDSSVLYYFNDLNEFVPLTNTSKLRINNYTNFDLNNHICTINNTGTYVNKYIDISKISLQLSIVSNVLTVNNLPNSSNESTIAVSHKEGMDGQINVYFKFENNDVLKTV